VIPLAERGNKVITISDVEKANEQAKVLAANLEEEIIHQIPVGYTIDSRSHILNPLGLYSHRLETDLLLICAKLSSIESLSRSVSQAGYDIKKLYFSGLATSGISVRSDEFKHGLNVFCDIGRDITELLIFNDSVLKDIVILTLGGDDITLHLAQEFKLPYDLAEDTKKKYGCAADSLRIEEGKEILIKRGSGYRPLSQRAVCELISSKTKSMCQGIKDALIQKLDTAEIDNFVTVGRAILLEGFLEMLENTLGTRVKIGRIPPENSNDLEQVCDELSGQRYLNFITSLGEAYNAIEVKSQPSMPQGDPSAGKNAVIRFIDRAKEVYEEYF